MKNFDNNLLKFADLVVTKGINVQKNQPVVISCPIERADFARTLARKSYEKGASEVILNWSDDELTLLKYENAPMEIFEEYPKWAVDKSKYYYEKGAALISVHATDPELLKNADPKKIATANKVASIANKDNMKYTMNDINSWCVVSVPTTGWAKRVFPNISEEEAVEKLWEAIFYTTRVDVENPIEEWNNHVSEMDKHAEFLNEKSFTKLHYKNSKGTDLVVELPEGHVWLSAGSKNVNGTIFIANMPTEEVFTLPKKDAVNGKLFSTKPLNYGGNIIDEMEFTFKDGKVVEYDAKVGKQYLDDMFAVDENGKYLGEVALVPYDSPISNSNILFYNTLFDENASCHFAFGKAYPTCLKGGTEMTEEELLSNGVNDALIHEDFMVGSSDLSITGITSTGEEIKIFENGNWVI
ncbi:aminopeptidase [Miniphocaeibacter massiliensis]|uniref:aminopeptidase n=1 Tax=Miniphocaeibacter massiliensis TaxID=2041841 RepID=UPI000C1C2C40|nr:aminopeptidase [Miniphocaeibacter massiliensis]